MTQQQPVPQQQYAAPEEEGGVKGALTRQIGPLQAWQWGAIVIGAYLIWRYVHGSSTASSAPAFVPSSDPGTTGSTGAPLPNPIDTTGGVPPFQPPTGTGGGTGAVPPTPKPTSTPTPTTTFNANPTTTSVHIPAPTTSPISAKSGPPSPSLTGTKVHLPLARPITGQSVYKTKAGGTRVVNTPKVPASAIRSGQLYEGGPTAKKPAAPKRPVVKAPIRKSNAKPVKL